MKSIVHGLNSLIRNLVVLVSAPLLGTKSIPRVEQKQDDELSLSFDAEISPKTMCKALDDLRGHFQLKRLELQAPGLEMDDRQRMVAVHALSGAVIQMSLLTHLSLSENLLTEISLLHISVLPILETFVVFPAPPAGDLSGEETLGFESLRSLDLPNETLLRRFLSYSLQDVEVLKVANLGRNSLKLIRGLTGLQFLRIEGPSFGPPEIFALGACFRLEGIEIQSCHPLGMDDSDLHRFRAMFQNLRSLSIVAQDM